MKKGKKNHKSGKAALLDPGELLTGKDLWKAANASARIELRPSLKSYHRQYKRLQRDQGRDVKALGRLGNQTAKQTKQLYGMADKQLGLGLRTAQEAGQQLVHGVADVNQQGAERQDQLQGSVLGGQINSLAAQQIDQGGSASQNALAQAAASQQTAQSDMAGEWDKFAAMQASGMAETAQNQRMATASQGAASAAAIRQVLASRKAQTITDYREDKQDLAGKIADTKALFGPTRLKNIMDLRAGERSFANERAAIQADKANDAFDNNMDAQELALAKQKEANDQKNGGDGSGGDGPSDNQDDAHLGPKEYRQYAAALKQYLDGGKVGPGGWNTVLGDLSSQEGVNWSPVEMQKFKRRAKKSGRFQ